MPQPTRTPLTPAKRAQLRRLPASGLLRVDGAAPREFRVTPQRHNLTEAECREANRRLRHLEHTRPIASGPGGSARRALRVAGVISAIRRRVVGSSAFGRTLHGHRGGNVMRNHALAHLRAWSPVARLAAMMARERREAEAFFEAHGEVLAPGTRPPQTKEEARVRHLITLWEAAEWQQQRDRLAW